MVLTLNADPTEVKSGPKRKTVSNYISGFCGIGSHQDHINITERGSVLQACRGTYYFGFMQGGAVECMCSCHDMYRAIENLEPLDETEEDIFSAFKVPPAVKKAKPPVGALTGLPVPVPTTGNPLDDLLAAKDLFA